MHEMVVNQITEIVASWPLFHPVTGYYDSTMLFLHTLPLRFARIVFPTFTDKMMLCGEINGNGYYANVEP